MKGVECRLDPDSRVLLCKHPFGFEGYLEPGGVLEPGSRNEWFDTRDVAEITPAGRLKILGRSDHRVNRDGLLVDLDRIARTIEEIPGIDSCVCAGDGEGPRGKKIVAFCTPGTGPAVDPGAVRKRCLDLLARREVPDEVVVLGEFPRLPSGKVDLQNLIGGWRAGRGAPE
jgi:acyl-CoA synthetase (AMP-forming)/AMP-acid ligase II